MALWWWLKENRTPATGRPGDWKILCETNRLTVILIENLIIILSKRWPSGRKNPNERTLARILLKVPFKNNEVVY